MDEVSQYRQLFSKSVDCPICSCLLCPPVTTSCGHSFCQNCFEQSMKHQPKCPLCRETWLTAPILQVNVLLAEMLSKIYVAEYNQRLQEIQAEKDKYVTRYFAVGNRHRLVESTEPNIHDWTFYVTCRNKSQCPHLAGHLIPTSYYIKEVQVELHPTFQQSHLILGTDPFEINRRGWGIFVIRARIIFHPSFGIAPLEIQHLLSFASERKERIYEVKVPKCPPHAPSLVQS